jgi:two-component system, NarL family, invasion response regulator UvrY
MLNNHSKIKIAIVDDHNLFRKGLVKLISLGDRDNKFTILFEAENGIDLKEKISKKNLPDIVLMDIDMQDMDGYETVSWLKKYYPDVKILVISMFETEEAIVRMLRLGVNGYLSKDIEVEDMHTALEAIIKRGIYYSDYVAEIMAQSIQNVNSVKVQTNTIWSKLSENEREFVKLACTELTYQQIADKMKLSPKTVEGYREALFLKFGVKNRVGLAMFAVRNNLVKVN